MAHNMQNKCFIRRFASPDKGLRSKTRAGKMFGKRFHLKAALFLGGVVFGPLSGKMPVLGYWKICFVCYNNRWRRL